VLGGGWAGAVLWEGALKNLRCEDTRAVTGWKLQVAEEWTQFDEFVFYKY